MKSVPLGPLVSLSMLRLVLSCLYYHGGKVALVDHANTKMDGGNIERLQQGASA